MKFSLVNHKAFISNVNVRAERHGDKTEPAGDIKFKVDIANQELCQLHPSLLSCLYFHDSSQPGDLVDKANEENPDYLPHLRFPNLAAPLKWKDEMIGGTLTIHYGVDQNSWIVLETIKVDELLLTPKAGGTVEVVFSVQAHPDEEQFGKLATMVQNECTISLKPPEAQAELA